MVNFSFYRGTYGGSSISQESWTYYEGKACDKLRQYVRDYTVKIPAGSEDAEEKAICAMADVYATYDAIGSGSAGPVSSLKTGEISVSYAVNASAVDLSERGQARALYEAARQYLDIYRGVE